jgi:carboxyl-terminal processing protease
MRRMSSGDALPLQTVVPPDENTAGAVPRLRRPPFLLAAALTAAILAAFLALNGSAGEPYDRRASSAAVARASEVDDDLQAALRALDDAVRLDPANAVAHSRRAALRAVTGDLRGAARDYRVAVILRPKSREAYLGRSSVRLQAGDLNGAIADLETAIRLDPEDPFAHLELASVRAYGGDIAAYGTEVLRAADLLERRGQTSLAQSVRAIAGRRPPEQTEVRLTAPRSADVVTAERVLSSQYVGNPLPTALLNAAWEGARSLAQQRGATVPDTLAPQITRLQSASEAAVQRALDALIEASAGYVSRNELLYAAIEAMAASLHDNHTSYLRPEIRRLQEPGKSYGFGFQGIASDGGRILVSEVVAGGPADLAGLRPGDVILETTDSLDSGRITSSEPRTVTVERSGQSLSLTLRPQPFSVQNVTSRLLDRDVGYIRLRQFDPPTEFGPDGVSFVERVDAAIEGLKALGAKRWLLDLRGNPGGAIAGADVVAGRFGYNGVLDHEVYKTGAVRVDSGLGKGVSARAPLAVLVDQGSYSAAELLAGALQDAGRARVFGTVTGGKVNGAAGAVIGGGVLRVTVARIRVGPRLLALDGVGVTPDEQVSVTRDDILAGRDPQLEAALRYLRSLRAR